MFFRHIHKSLRVVDIWGEQDIFLTTLGPKLKLFLPAGGSVAALQQKNRKYSFEHLFWLENSEIICFTVPPSNEAPKADGSVSPTQHESAFPRSDAVKRHADGGKHGGVRIQMKASSAECVLVLQVTWPCTGIKVVVLHTFCSPEVLLPACFCCDKETPLKFSLKQTSRQIPLWEFPFAEHFPVRHWKTLTASAAPRSD